MDPRHRSCFTRQRGRAPSEVHCTPSIFRQHGPRMICYDTTIDKACLLPRRETYVTCVSAYVPVAYIASWSPPTTNPRRFFRACDGPYEEQPLPSSTQASLLLQPRGIRKVPAPHASLMTRPRPPLRVVPFRPLCHLRLHAQCNRAPTRTRRRTAAAPNAAQDAID